MNAAPPVTKREARGSLSASRPLVGNLISRRVAVNPANGKVATTQAPITPITPIAPSRASGVRARWPLATAARCLAGARRSRLFWSARCAHVAGPAAKRCFDLLAASTILLLLSPLLVVVAAAVKLSGRGPALFWQVRVGRRGRKFLCPKFRSMVVDAERRRQSLLKRNDHGDSVTFKMKRDPRITSVGRILRKLSLDELPQLWCVLRGQMSLVGPRPPILGEVERYSVRDRRRLEAVPGLTCIWQVSGRGDIPFAGQVEMDIDYVERQSFLLDFQLLLRTIPAVVSGRGAY